MSRGLEGFYKKLSVNDDEVIYAYCGEDFNFPFNKELANIYDGRIGIKVSSIEKKDAEELLKSGDARIIKNCYYADLNTSGVDILGMFTVRKIIRKYKETSKLSEEGHWIV